MIISRLLEIYLWIACSVLLYEVFHLLFAWKFKLKIIRAKIGESFFAIKNKNISISPIIFGGYVEVDEKKLFQKEPYKVVIFFVAGSIANLLIIIITLVFVAQYDLKNIIIIINSILIVSSLCPVLKGNDARGIIKLLKRNKKEL